MLIFFLKRHCEIPRIYREEKLYDFGKMPTHFNFMKPKIKEIIIEVLLCKRFPKKIYSFNPISIPHYYFIFSLAGFHWCFILCFLHV